jgi:membrane-bound lytic murein transglycosylase A
MIRDGVITTSQGSMQEIKKYFANNPQNISKYLSQNKRYIFFSLSDEGAIGSGGGELVGGRSIATDKSIYPAGGLVFVKVRQPVLDANNKIKYWKPISRFVVDQDTGSAIRGKARADLYFGTGEEAGAKAGHYHEKKERSTTSSRKADQTSSNKDTNRLSIKSILSSETIICSFAGSPFTAE